MNRTIRRAGGIALLLAGWLTACLSPPPEPPAMPTASPRLPATVTPAPRATSCQPEPFWDADPTTLGITTLTGLRFVDEQTIEVRGWGPRTTPLPTALPAPPPSPLAPTPWEGGDGYAPFHDQPKAVRVTLPTGSVQPQPLDLACPLHNPCASQPCQIEVVAQSADGRWQVAHVWDEARTMEGAWLLGREQAAKLTTRVPSSASIQWDEQGALLWYEASVPTYGRSDESALLWLSDPPHVLPLPPRAGVDAPVTPATVPTALDPARSRLTLDPARQQLLALPRDPVERETWPLTPLVWLDLRPAPPTVAEESRRPYAIDAEWDAGRDELLLMVAQPDALLISTAAGEPLARLPFPALDPTTEELRPGLPWGAFALAPSGQWLALARPPASLTVYDCAPE